ncbi:MAG: hypothetical protein U5K84_12120, partial [Alkalibacterium sp.]|nr:hypothetical protein [Alkalibacterium sp.]
VTLLNGFAWTMMNIIPAIFAAYMAYAIGDKAAIIPGFIGGYIAAHPPLEIHPPVGFRCDPGWFSRRLCGLGHEETAYGVFEVDP